MTDLNDENVALELHSLAQAQSLTPELLAAAQRQYDAWDESDVDTYAGGGICHLIADDLAQVLSRKGIEASSVSSSHEQHVYVALQVAEGVYTLDIPWPVYERGGGYNWTKLPSVTFEPQHLVWSQVSEHPSAFESYCCDY